MVCGLLGTNDAGLASWGKRFSDSGPSHDDIHRQYEAMVSSGRKFPRCSSNGMREFIRSTPTGTNTGWSAPLVACFLFQNGLHMLPQTSPRHYLKRFCSCGQGARLRGTKKAES